MLSPYHRYSLSTTFCWFCSSLLPWGSIKALQDPDIPLLHKDPGWSTKKAQFGRDGLILVFLRIHICTFKSKLRLRKRFLDTSLLTAITLGMCMIPLPHHISYSVSRTQLIPKPYTGLVLRKKIGRKQALPCLQGVWKCWTRMFASEAVSWEWQRGETKQEAREGSKEEINM